MAYNERGEAENPRIVVCVHCMTRNAPDFGTFAEALDGSHRVFCIGHTPPLMVTERINAVTDWLSV